MIPIEYESDLEESAAGGLRKYADPALIEREKGEVFRRPWQE